MMHKTDFPDLGLVSSKLHWSEINLTSYISYCVLILPLPAHIMIFRVLVKAKRFQMLSDFLSDF